jgi:hypothetical protein
MGLFSLKEDKIVLDPDTFAIPEFLKIWKADRSTGKADATKILSYIYFYCDFASPYAIYPLHQRKEMLIKDFLRGDGDLIKSVAVEDAIKKYKSFNDTPSMRLLESAQIACDKLADYFETLDFKELDDTGRPVYLAKDVAANLKAVGGIIESLNKTTEQVKKEVTASVKVRGGGEIGDYER